MQVCFVVKVLDKKEKYLKAAYARNLELPFVPSVGMRITGGTSTWLWETRDGNELAPSIKEVVYNIDEETVYCLFEIYDESLCNSFWTDITKHIGHSIELSQFEVHYS